MNRKNWSVLLLGIIIGVVATSAYWYTRQEHSKFLFDHNVKCQQIAKQYETGNNLPRHLVLLLQTTYSPTRNSCVAEVVKIGDGSIDYTLEDLLSRDSRIVFHLPIQNAIHDPQELVPDQKLLSDYDAQFASFAHNPKH